MNNQSTTDLYQAFGVSGFETQVRDVIIKELEGLVEDMFIDNLGNLIMYIPGRSSRNSLMFTAHMDEIGVMISGVDKEGIGKVSNIGGVYPKYSQTNRIRFESGNIGVIYADDKGELKVDGCGKKLKVGDVAQFTGETIFTGNSIISKALDNRLGCHILIDVIKQQASRVRAGNKPPTDLFFVFTVQEEVGLRGAGVAAHQIKPQMAINVDITSSSTSVKLKSGVAIKLKDRSVICDQRMVKLLIDTSEDFGIRYQLDVSDTGGTDTASVQMSGDGVICGAISVPIKFTHSISEVAHLQDVIRAVRLLTKVIESEQRRF